MSCPTLTFPSLPPFLPPFSSLVGGRGRQVMPILFSRKGISVLYKSEEHNFRHFIFSFKFTNCFQVDSFQTATRFSFVFGIKGFLNIDYI
jgi:hypothetical protein